MATKDIFNPATWTEQDRQFIDAAMRLDPEQIEFMIQFMKYLAALDPARKDKVIAYIMKNADKSVLNTPESRAAFMQELRAV